MRVGGDTRAGRVRRGDRADLPFFEQMLYEGIVWNPARPREPVREALTEPQAARYIEDWGQEGDIAVVAETVDGRPIGAAWVRTLPKSGPGYGFVDASIPEVTIGVAVEHRGRGVGDSLLTALAETVRDAGFAAMSLSVELSNPAVALYRRHGFATVGTNGGSWTMLRELEPNER